MEYLKLLMSEL